MRKQEKKIVIPCCNTYEFLQLEEIIRLEGLQNYTKIFTTSNKVIVSTTNIGFYKETLVNHGFFCCHKSHLVNERHILRYHKEGKLELLDHSKVPVSRRKRQEFLEEVVKKYSLNQNNEKKTILAAIPMQQVQNYMS